MYQKVFIKMFRGKMEMLFIGTIGTNVYVAVENVTLGDIFTEKSTQWDDKS